LFHGPVRVPDEAGSGMAILTFTFENWEEGKVASSTITLPIVESKKDENRQSAEGTGKTIPSNKETPTPEEARSALLRLLQGEPDASLNYGDGPELQRKLRSADMLEALRKEKITSEAPHHFVGGWTFTLGELTFFKVMPWLGHQYQVYGVLDRTTDGRWNAKITEMSHVNLGPPK
jgi:hypothetical protein